MSLNPDLEEEQVKEPPTKKAKTSQTKKKGRPSNTFSTTKRKSDKLKKLDEALLDIAGCEEDKMLLLETYQSSHYCRGIISKSLEEECLTDIGRNSVRLIYELPTVSPLRIPLVASLSRDISPTLLSKVLETSLSTIKRSRKIDLKTTLLYTLRYKPGTSRRADNDPAEYEEERNDDQRIWVNSIRISSTC
ncbi:hypothetical protein PROFUN_10443 [Planoprotostelium fungivorum]|uniref:Uncharacterized protein n=1 Tax=Planoprotostelium fungivorum TaxID=1890364 RepID=A0A2P6NE21_9EUKA|nr:hypothetical protein PROFUN_10443 [Planoprotostelium fungivorum]